MRIVLSWEDRSELNELTKHETSGCWDVSPCSKTSHVILLNDIFSESSESDLFDSCAFSNSCRWNFSNASSIKESGTFLCETFIFPMYKT